MLNSNASGAGVKGGAGALGGDEVMRVETHESDQCLYEKKPLKLPCLLCHMRTQ